MTNRCPLCHVEIERDKLMCAPHWYRVPGPLRRRIWRAYQEKNWKTWLALRAQAIAAVEDKQEIKR